MLKVTNLSVSYGETRVVDRLNLQLGDDEILMLVGPTGCGKTTILQALAGLVPISEGEISLPGWTATTNKNIAPEKRNVGMVFQDFALFPHLTVQENVCFKLKDEKLADHWIKLLGLDAFRNAKPGRLSGGQKQRVALARTLAHEPAFVLLDEPLSNLDAALKDSLRWEIRQALKVAKVPAIWVTHDQDEALSVGDRVGVLNKGQLEQLASPEICFDQPKSRFVARFLGEASFLTAEVNENCAHTELGMAPVRAQSNLSKCDLLIRPDDLSVQAVAEGGNGQVDWQRFEGESRLYAITLDSGIQVKVRSSHENSIAIGARVAVVVSTTHPLAVFS
ncbi:ABC transporter ATP-binding protein [Catenovulum adriaticum]|uniref:ABC transporter ATP-binding protein n=1 Tax=Catenovulum adriaticum TaxID=2984846 RepID=A0ABY7APL5_9ALTE|nr:ABC transporter ATP-binding protein [Catenovulum sp. TS8]WAJ71439.1 ABC transporter ATP-binding protein [Catenovulum sp. TS8]